MDQPTHSDCSDIKSAQDDFLQPERDLCLRKNLQRKDALACPEATKIGATSFTKSIWNPQSEVKPEPDLSHEIPKMCECDASKSCIDRASCEKECIQARKLSEDFPVACLPMRFSCFESIERWREPV